MAYDINNCYCVIMAGGIGSRFWPWSREDRPKQFLDITGSGRTMIQETFDRFEALLPADNLLVVTGEHFEGEVLKQLPALLPSQVLTEPERRNTAPAIAYVAYHIAAQNPDATLIVTPSDHHIGDAKAFRQTMQEALQYVEEHATLMTIGIKPTFPATGYGYIELSEEAEREGKGPIVRFKEKPDRESAQQMVESGRFLWNSGMFVWKVRDIIQALEQYLPEVAIHFAELVDQRQLSDRSLAHQAFRNCPSISIDYGVMECAKNVGTIVGDFSWNDLGTWQSLQEYRSTRPEGELASDANLLLIDSPKTLVHEENPSKRVIAIGLEDFLVADMDDVLFIAPKGDEASLHKLLEQYSKLL